MRALETIKISFRTHIAYQLAHSYGPLGYLDGSNFTNTGYHQINMSQLKIELERSDEIFVRHHKQKYASNFPIGVAIEVTSFGLLSKIYNNMQFQDQNLISREYYNSKVEFMTSWLHSLSDFN